MSNTGMGKKIDYRKAIAELYDDWSISYDIDNAIIPAYSHLDHIYFNIIKQHLKHLDAKLTLDVGSGTGAQTLFLAKFGIHVIGIDLSLKSIKVAKSKAKHNGLSKMVDFILGDASHLPIKKEAIGSIVSLGLVPSHNSMYNEIVTEISRVLREDGYFIIDFQNKYSPLCLIHYLIDTFTRGKVLQLGFSRFSQIRDYIKNGTCIWEYECKISRKQIKIPFYAVSVNELKEMLNRNNLKWNGIYGIHIFTLIIPLGVQEQTRSRVISLLITVIGKLEQFVYGLKPFNQIGSVLMAAGQKQL